MPEKELEGKPLYITGFDQPFIKTGNYFLPLSTLAKPYVLITSAELMRQICRINISVLKLDTVIPWTRRLSAAILGVALACDLVLRELPALGL